MSNYPPGVTDNDPYFTDETPHEGEEELFECNACGAILSVDMIDSLQGHVRVDDDGRGEPIQVHCGPCVPKEQQSK